jgi:3',5'-nucleoside bisphosphate phosphatase
VRIDLHTHSNASDGSLPPAEVIRLAHEKGVEVIALTDHDTTFGHAEATAALSAGMTLVRGMEMSCRLGDRSLHLLGYLFDPADAALNAECLRIRDGRDNRARAMVDRLGELGTAVTWEQVSRIADGGVIGRPHIAKAMVAAGVIDDMQDAFTAEWIGFGGRAHVERYAPHPVRAIGLVRAAGGVAVLAHPRVDRGAEVFSDAEIAELAEAGLGGLEVDHPMQRAESRAELRGLAAELGLFVTGSSDDHGEATGYQVGCESTSPDALDALREAATGRPS